MVDRYWPLGAGRTITSPFGPRPGEFHTGVDFGRQGGSAGMPIYAVQAGTVIYAGAAQGYGGPDPAGWLVIDSTDTEGGGCLEYGHLVREVAKGQHVTAGQRIGHINPDQRTNGGVAPHLHLSDMPGGYDPRAMQDPMPRLRGALEPGAAAPSSSTPSPGGTVTLTDPFTGAVWSPNRSRRLKPSPRWIAIHTQEGGRTARGLADFLANPASQVSYHAVVDEHERLKCVAEQDRPWAAMNANDHAFHVCAAGSYAGWSRGKWLETDARDGKNEDAELTSLAMVVAWWCDKYRIPADWIGGRGIPWGRDGICGHADFGQWGGGHHDPGPGFPVDELIRRVRGFLANGSAPTPLPAPVPVLVPGTTPASGVLLYRGRPGQDPAQVRKLQERLRRNYSKLVVDGDFGPHTEACVRDWQHLHPPLVADGIVGPATAAALGLLAL